MDSRSEGQLEQGGRLQSGLVGKGARKKVVLTIARSRMPPFLLSLTLLWMLKFSGQLI